MQRNGGNKLMTDEQTDEFNTMLTAKGIAHVSLIIKQATVISGGDYISQPILVANPKKKIQE